MNGNVLDLLSFMEATGAVDNAFEWLQDVELDSRIDKSTMAGQLLKECGALTPVYHEVQAFMYNHKLWFRVNALVLSHLCDTLDYEYDPLENYDWKEVGNKVNNSKRLSDSESVGTKTTDSSYTDTEGINDFKYQDTDTIKETDYSNKTNMNNTETHNLQVDNTHKDEETTSAYNEDLYQPDNKLVGEYHTGDTGTIGNVGEEKQSGDNTVTGKTQTGSTGVTNRVLVHDAKEQSVESGETRSTAEIGRDTQVHERFIKGATGNFSKQQLIDQEREIAKFNIYEFIAQKYAKDNCYRVY